MFRLRNEDAAQRILDSIRREDVNLRFMHVCGTHQDTLVRFGLDPMLREVGIEIRQGPEIGRASCRERVSECV